jgi:hypothetical protein
MRFPHEAGYDDDRMMAGDYRKVGLAGPDST